jgi:iron complex outermembrane receptor protein
MFSTNTRIGRLGVCTVLMLGTAVGACPVFAQQAAPPPRDSAQPNELEDIVVTAQKREQSLQTVPISVSVMTAETIQANRIENVKDLSALAPNLVVRLSGGGAQIPNYTLRGIVTAGVSLGTDKGVGLYIDGVYVQTVAGSVFDFADIARIEVLKGPQGTLFGRNATGGAISITTKNPTGVLGGYQQFTYGNYDQFRSKTHIDLPQLGPISASVTYLHSQRRGDVRNLGAGTRINYGPASGGALGVLTSPKYLGGGNTDAVNAAVKFDFHPDLSLVYKFDYASAHLTPNASGIAYLLPGNYLAGLYASSSNPMTPISTKRPDAVNNSLSAPTYNRVMGHNLTAAWHVNDDISFKNILSYRKSYTTNFYQLDGLGGLQVPIAPGLSAPFSVITNTSKDDDSQWSNEFQMNISNQWFNLTAGYLHFHSFQQTGGFSNIYNVPTFLAYVGQNTSAVGMPGVAPANPGYEPSHIRVNSDAWFIQPEIHLTSKLDIVGGARITSDRKDGVEPFPIPGAGPANVIRYRDRGEITYLAGINYRPTDNILTYAKYADGYISGGQLATITFKPERAFSYEVGVKAELFQHRFRSNLAIFDVKYQNIQVTTLGLLTGVPSAAAFATAVVPVGDARAKGFEWENTLVPVNGLTLTANLGYTDFHYIKDTLFAGIVYASGAPGYRVQSRPKWTGQLSAQYETAEVLNGGHLVFRMDGNFKSKETLSSDIAPGSGPSALVDPILKNAVTVPFSWLVNGRVALAGIELGRTKAEIAVWSRNIFNNRNMTQFVGLDLGTTGFVGSAIYQDARTFGLDASISF